MSVSPVYELTVFDDDDVAELFDVSTDPAHARPYLKAPTNFPEQELDFAKGAASIGQMNLEIVDVRTDATDQDTGYFTGQLATAGGFSALNGHRALVTEDIGSGAVTILDGVIKGVKLLDTFVTYSLELRDIRERERKAKAFANTDTPTILPRGVLAGYGVQLGSFRFPLQPTAPLTAFYRADSATRGEFELTEGAAQIPELKLTEPMREALESISPLAASPEVLVFDRWKVLWRDTAAGGAYTELTRIAHTHASLPGSGGRFPYTAGGGIILGVRVNNLVDSDTLPSNGQAVDIIIQYDGPVTSDWAFHLQDLTVGELLRNLYRGDYSVEDPRIRYNEAALLLLTTPVRLRLEEPIEDIREWTEENAYPIAHAVPTLNADGEIAPITYLLPDSTVTPTTIDNSNARPAGGGWNHGTQDAINLVKVTYLRDFRVPPTDDADDLQALSDQIHTREIEEEHRIQDSIDLLGEQPLELKSVLLRSVGNSAGGPVFGDVTDETGSQVASRITRMATDRFALGAQYFDLFGDRADSDIEALKTGDWCLVNVSWMPDYVSGERGLARLAQVVSRRNVDGAWTALGLIDAGSDAAPFATPTLGTVTVDAAGVVSVPVTALAAGSECRVDYAVSASEPAAGSELWSFLGPRVTSTPTTLTTPPAPPNINVWVRARSEGVGRRPSAYTTAVSVATPSTPRVVDVGATLDGTTGLPTVTWTPNSLCLGVRIQYEVHQLSTVPSYGTQVDFDAADLTADITGVTVPEGWVLSLQVVPYPGWTGAAVSGSPGPVVRLAVEQFALDVVVLNAFIRAIPFVDVATQNTGVLIEVHYDVSAAVDELDFDYTWDDGGGPAVFSNSGITVNGVAGVHRITNVGDFLFQEGYTDFSVDIVPLSQPGDVAGRTVTVALEDTDDSGVGVRAALSAGGNAVSDMFVPGTNVTIDRDGNGRIRVNAVTGAGAALTDLSDVTVTAPATRHALMYDGATWVNRLLVAADIPNLPTSILTSGQLGVARGGTGRSTLNGIGRVLISTDATTLTTVDSGAAGGYLRSNGTTWVRASIQTGDISEASVTQHEAALTIGALQISGVLRAAVGGTNLSSFVGIGRLMVSTSSTVLAMLDSGADGGFVRSDGTTWVRGTIATGDVPNLAASKITSGTFADARIPSLNASKITAGVFAVARGGTGLSTFTGIGRVLISTGATGLNATDSGADGGFLRSNGTTWVRGTIATGDVPSLNASKITAGTFAVDRIPNHDDLNGFVVDEHVAHATVAITGTGNLGGGGTIAASRAITMDAAISLTSVSCTGDVTGNTSDRRLKKITGELRGTALDAVRQWRAVRYVWNDRARQLGLHDTDHDRDKLGLFAQEVGVYAPEAIAPAPFDADKDTLESLSGHDYKTIRYAELVPVLVAAIQELEERVEELTP